MSSFSLSLCSLEVKTICNSLGVKYFCFPHSIAGVTLVSVWSIALEPVSDHHLFVKSINWWLLEVSWNSSSARYFSIRTYHSPSNRFVPSTILTVLTKPFNTLEVKILMGFSFGHKLIDKRRVRSPRFTFALAVTGESAGNCPGTVQRAPIILPPMVPPLPRPLPVHELPLFDPELLPVIDWKRDGRDFLCERELPSKLAARTPLTTTPRTLSSSENCFDGDC